MLLSVGGVEFFLHLLLTKSGLQCGYRKTKEWNVRIIVEMYSPYNAQRLFTFTLEGSEVREIDFL